jgi:hypothetical protein
MDEGIEAYEKRYRQQRVISLTAKAKDLVPVTSMLKASITSPIHRTG